MTIVTNNPAVLGKFSDAIEVSGNPVDVMNEVLERLQGGFRLVGAPLSANNRLIRNPFRSVILERADRQYDSRGIKAVQKALIRLEGERFHGTWNSSEKALADYQFIDCDLLEAAVQ